MHTFDRVLLRDVVTVEIGAPATFHENQRSTGKAKKSFQTLLMMCGFAKMDTVTLTVRTDTGEGLTPLTGQTVRPRDDLCSFKLSCIFNDWV